MIFSKDICPLCGDKLFVKYFVGAKDLIDWYYCCPIMVDAFNDIDFTATYSHYTYKKNPNNQYSEMIILPYIVRHVADDNSPGITQIFTLTNDMGIRKLILEIPLLDIDYANPQVNDKIKVLITFS